MRSSFETVWEHLVVEDPLPPAGSPRFDAIFCFGSRHWRVPERAADLFHAGVADRVVVTGGPAAAGEETECERFRRALITRGVPASAIVEEHDAAHTGENVRFGTATLRAVGPADRLLLVSWPLAAQRCRATFAALEPGIAVASAPALRRPGWRWTPSARRARFALGELRRLEEYGRRGLIAAVPSPPAVVAAADALRAGLSANGATSPDVEPAGPQLGAEGAALLG